MFNQWLTDVGRGIQTWGSLLWGYWVLFELFSAAKKKKATQRKAVKPYHQKRICFIFATLIWFEMKDCTIQLKGAQGNCMLWKSSWWIKSCHMIIVRRICTAILKKSGSRRVIVEDNSCILLFSIHETINDMLWPSSLIAWFPLNAYIHLSYVFAQCREPVYHLESCISSYIWNVLVCYRCFMQHELVNSVFMCAGCLRGPAVCICSRHRFALGGMVWLQNEIHADKALHQFINQMCVCCELDLGDFFIIVLPKVTFSCSAMPMNNCVLKCLFLGVTCACSLHAEFAWQMFFKSIT